MLYILLLRMISRSFTRLSHSAQFTSHSIRSYHFNLIFSRGKHSLEFVSDERRYLSTHFLPLPVVSIPFTDFPYGTYVTQRLYNCHSHVYVFIRNGLRAREHLYRNCAFHQLRLLRKSNLLFQVHVIN